MRTVIYVCVASLGLSGCWIAWKTRDAVEMAHFRGAKKRMYEAQHENAERDPPPSENLLETERDLRREVVESRNRAQAAYRHNTALRAACGLDPEAEAPPLGPALAPAKTASAQDVRQRAIDYQVEIDWLTETVAYYEAASLVLETEGCPREAHGTMAYILNL